MCCFEVYFVHVLVRIARAQHACAQRVTAAARVTAADSAVGMPRKEGARPPPRQRRSRRINIIYTSDSQEEPSFRGWRWTDFGTSDEDCPLEPHLQRQLRRMAAAAEPGSGQPTPGCSYASGGICKRCKSLCESLCLCAFHEILPPCLVVLIFYLMCSEFCDGLHDQMALNVTFVIRCLQIFWSLPAMIICAKANVALRLFIQIQIQIQLGNVPGQCTCDLCWTIAALKCCCD